MIKSTFFFLAIFCLYLPNTLANNDITRINSLYEEGLLTREECKAAKRKILGSSSKPDCKKASTIKKELDIYSSQGTAFFITEQGHAITNDHVINKCDSNVKIKYKTKDYETRILAQDKFLDLALIKIDQIGRTDYLKISTKSPIKLQQVIAVGFPFGKYVSDDLKFTSGIVSSIKGPGDDSTRMQIDASLNPGNSGGPIVDIDTGDVVGVAVAKLDPSVSEGTNFAIKSSSLKNFLVANALQPRTSLISIGSSREKILRSLENTTLFVFCD